MASLVHTAGSMGRSTFKSTGIGVDVWTDSMMQRDQEASMRVAQPPPAITAFRFQPKRSRIDWRMLHGVDINGIVRDVDLDTLEKIVNIVAFGDIEAEDTRHLTELNFLKIFKLAQLVIEYLLYVQDTLQTTNTWLKADRSQLEKYMEVTRIRIKELTTETRSSKRELRRARKTAKTYEAMVALGKLPGAGNSTGAMVPDKASLLAGDTLVAAQQAKEAAAAASAMESLLRSELLVLSERLARTETECAKLRVEREELMVHLRDIDSALRNRAVGGLMSKNSADSAELRSAKEQLSKAHADNKLLRSEKEDMMARLGLAQQRAEVLQGEKEALLQEMAARPGDATSQQQQPGTGTDASGSQVSLSAMLLDAEARNKALQSELDQLHGTVGTLQKQLMRAAKDAAKPALPPSASVEELQRALTAADSGRAELSARVTELERELNSQRKAHDQALFSLQEELTNSQGHMADLQRQLELAHAVKESTVAGGAFASDAMVGAAASSNKDAAQLQQQLAELEHALSHAQQAAHTQTSELQSRCARLADQLNVKEQLLAEAWKLVKELQLQLTVPAANRDPEAVGRVKAQVQEFEQIAQAGLLLTPEQTAGIDSSPAREVAAVSAISPVRQKHIKEQDAAASADSPHNTSFRFSKPDKTPPRSPGPTADRVEAGEVDVNALDRQHQGTAAVENDAAAGEEADTPNVSRALTHNVFASPQSSQMGMQQPVRPQMQKRSSEQLSAISQRILQHMAGKTPDEVAAIADDEMRVLSEHPYEYADDDEEHFRSVFKHELPGTAWGGVLSAQPHSKQELEHALQQQGHTVMNALTDALASYGIDAETTTMLSDRRYAAVMTELSQRRDAAWSRLAPEQQERAEFLRDAMLTHLELVARKVSGLEATPAFPEPEGRIHTPAPRAPPASSMVQSSPRTLTSTYGYDGSEATLTSSKTGGANSTATGAGQNHVGAEHATQGDTSWQQQQASAAAGTSQSAPPQAALTAMQVGGIVNQPVRFDSNNETNSRAQFMEQPSKPTAAAGSSAAAAAASGLSAAATTPFLQLAGAVSLAEGLHTSSNQSLPHGAGAAAGAASLNATSRAGSAVSSPTAARAAAAVGQQILNQSLHKKASQQALNQSLHKAAGPSTLNMTSGSAAGRGAGTMNMSIRSAGTAKASLRDYSTHMFDDDDDDGDDDAGVGTDRPSHNRDEYDLDEEEGRQMDQGLQDDEDRTTGSSSRSDRLSGGQQAAGMPPRAPSQATATAGGGWAASGSANRTIERSSSPSRLSKMSSSDGPLAQDIAELPPTVFNTAAAHQQPQPWQLRPPQQPPLPQPQLLQHSQQPAQPAQQSVQQGQQAQLHGHVHEEQESEEDWDSPPASSYQLPLVQPQRLQVQQPQSPEAIRPPKLIQQEQAVVPKVLQAKLSGNWADGSSLPREVAGGSGPGSDTHDYDAASIHSFHPNDTTRSNQQSGRPAAGAGGKAAGPPAWSSPNGTIRSRAGAAAPASENSVRSSKWNEAIQTFQSAGNEDVQAFRDPQSAELPAGSWVVGGGGGSMSRPNTLGGRPDAAKPPLRKDSFDTVSDVEFF